MISPLLTVLYVEDSAPMRRGMIRVWRSKDKELRFVEAASLEEAMSLFGSHIDRLIVDLCLGTPGNADGITFIEWVRERNAEIPIIVLTGELTLQRQLLLEERYAARAFVKVGGCDDAVLSLAPIIRSGARRPQLAEAANYDQIVDVMEALGGKFTKHHQALEEIAITRTHRRTPSITRGAQQVGMPRTTYTEKLTNLGLHRRR